MKLKTMFTNPNTYLTLIFVFTILLALVSLLHAVFKHRSEDIRMSSFQKNVLDVGQKIQSVQNKLTKVDSQLDSVSSLLEKDFKPQYVKLKGVMDEFYEELLLNKTAISKTFEAVTDPIFPLDIELYFKLNSTKLGTIEHFKRAIIDENKNGELENHFRANFPDEQIPFHQLSNGELISIGYYKYYFNERKLSNNSFLRFYDRANRIFEEALRDVNMYFTLDTANLKPDEYFNLDCNTLLVNEKLGNSKIKIQMEGSYPNGQAVILHLKINDANFGSSSNRINSLNELLAGKIVIEFNEELQPEFLYSLLRIGKGGKQTIPLYCRDEKDECIIQIKDYGFKKIRQYVFSPYKVGTELSQPLYFK